MGTKLPPTDADRDTFESYDLGIFTELNSGDWCPFEEKVINTDTVGWFSINGVDFKVTVQDSGDIKIVAMTPGDIDVPQVVSEMTVNREDFDMRVAHSKFVNSLTPEQQATYFELRAYEHGI